MTVNDSIAIVGGGITGLATAWWIRELNPRVKITLIESGDRLGGVLRTDVVDGYLIENSADMFSTENDGAMDLIRRLGRSDELVMTLPVTQRALIASDNPGQPILPVPNGFSLMLPNDVQSVLESELLDKDGKLRFSAEREVPAKLDDQDESVEAFAIRRFGQQTFDRLIQPLVSGIYTADPKRLSMQATMSRFLQLERRHGSLIRAAAVIQRNDQPSNFHCTTDAANELGRGDNRLAFADQTASGARYDLFRAPRKGMGQLIDWIVNDLERVEILKQTTAVDLRRSERGWCVTLEASDPCQASLSHEQRSFHFDANQTILEVDAVVICGSPNSAAQLIETHHSVVAANLRQIEAASCAVVVLGLEKRQLLQPFEGYGIVVPAYLNRLMIAVSGSSNKFPERAPADRMLFRCFLGGALRPELLHLSDAELLRITRSELNRLLPFVGEPDLTRVYRWVNAMPQYHLGHSELVERIEAGIRTLPGLALAGNSYNGVGIPVCIGEGKKVSERVLQYLQNRP